MIKENNPQEAVTPQNILVKIFTSPTEAFQFIDSYKYNKHVIFFLILSGIIKAFDKAESKGMGDNMSIWGVIAFSILIGLLFGWFFNYIYSWAISFTGSYFNGKANTQAILRVLAYSLLPSVFSLFFLFLRILVYGNAIFQSDYEYYNASSFDNIFYYVFLIIDISLTIWSFILFIIAISVVQKFSIGKAILNVIIPAILVVLSAIVIFILVDLFRPLN